MISCNKCNFSVNETMKHALQSNTCPSCGCNLFSSSDMNYITTIQSRLESQKFALNLSEKMAYDISLFAFNEIKDGVGKVIWMDRFEKLKSNESSDEQSDEVIHTEDELEDDDPKRKISDFKREIEEEYKDEIERVIQTDPTTEEIFSKAERLKRLSEKQKRENPRLAALTNMNMDPDIPGSRKIGSSGSGKRISRIQE